MDSSSSSSSSSSSAASSSSSSSSSSDQSITIPSLKRAVSDQSAASAHAHHASDLQKPDLTRAITSPESRSITATFSQPKFARVLTLSSAKNHSQWPSVVVPSGSPASSKTSSPVGEIALDIYSQNSCADGAASASAASDSVSLSPSSSTSASSSDPKDVTIQIDATKESEVTPVDVLIRQPSHTLPESATLYDSAPFESMMVILQDMGFSYQESEVALCYTNCKSIEEAIGFITSNTDGIYHAFVPANILSSSASITGLNNGAAAATVNLRLDASHEELESLSPEMRDMILAQNRQEMCAVCGLARLFHLIENIPVNNPHRTRFSIIDTAASTSVGKDDDTDSVSSTLSLAAERIPDDDSFRYGPPLHLLDDDDTVRRQNALAEAARSGNGAAMQLHPSILALLENDDNDEDEVVDERQKNIPNEPTESCQICLEDVSVSLFWIHPKCGHKFCKHCVFSDIRVKTNDGHIADEFLVCGLPSCNTPIPVDNIIQLMKSYCTPQEHDLWYPKFTKFRRNLEVSKDPSARWCIKPGCDTVLRGSERNPKMVCETCKTEVCFKCCQPYHGRKTCEEMVDAALSEWSAGKDVQQCPRCRVRIEKNDGCNHMTCGNCHYEFCWLCRGRYYSGHFSPINIFGCPGSQFAFESQNLCCKPGPLTMCGWRLLVLCGLAVGLGLAAGAGAVFLAFGSLYVLFHIFKFIFRKCSICCSRIRRDCDSTCFHARQANANPADFPPPSLGGSSIPAEYHASELEIYDEHDFPRQYARRPFYRNGLHENVSKGHY